MKKTLTHIIKSAAFSVAFIGFTLPAMAQLTPAQQNAVDTQTGIASPDRSTKFGEEAFKPTVSPRVQVKKLEIQGAPPGADKITFKLDKIKMDGVTVYSPGQLSAVYANRTGKVISLADLYVIAAELTRKYRNDGYILSQVVVPPQTIEGGVAKLRVVEGYIDNIEVRGNDKGLDLVRQYAEHIKTGRALNSKDLERALLLINDLAGVDARGVLNPSSSKTGAADLVIIANRKSYDGQLSLDNFGTRYLGPVQASAALSLNSMLGLNERITAQVAAAVGDDWLDQLKYGALSYEMPVWTDGTSVEVTANYTKTHPDYTLRQFDVRGWSSYVSAALKHPFIRSRAVNFNGHLKFDYRDVRTKNNIPVDPTRRDSIPAMRVGGNVETLDDFIGLAYNMMNFEFSQGLNIFGAGPDDRTTISRPAADYNFRKLNVELQRLQRISGAFNLLVGVSGQWANDALYSSEEFGVGGTSYGRGYDSSEIIGDEGLAGKAELQWNQPIKFSTMEDYQLFGFYDVGKVWNTDPSTNANKVNSLASAGFGIRAHFSPVAAAGLTVAFPLTAQPQTDNNMSPRILVNLNRRF